MTDLNMKWASAIVLAAGLTPSFTYATPPKIDIGRNELLKVATDVPASAPINQATVATFAYQPPLRGASQGGRVGGGTRGLGNKPLTVDVLAPDHTGLTVNEQPTLYWFVSETIDQPAELTVIDNESIDPLLEIKLKPPIQAGIHAVSLSDYGVQLKPQVPYQWFVGVVVDPAQRSNDIIAGGEIQLVSAPDSLRNDLRGVSEDQRPAVYAKAGIWYDALEGASTLVARGDPRWKELRAALLEQIGLEKAAAYARAK